MGEVRAVLLASARVPGVGAPLSESVLGAFSTVLERLERASQSTPSAAGNEGDAGGGGYAGAAQEARRLAVDAATLCALMPATAAAAGGGTASHGDSGGGGSKEDSGGGDLILRAGEAIVRAARAMAEAGLRERGPEFAALEVRRSNRERGVEVGIKDKISLIRVPLYRQWSAALGYCQWWRRRFFSSTWEERAPPQRFNFEQG